ncbi:hypothetical protein DPMN_186724 [Dreissena polymorpha]|uniref:Uncharacterized protein n=1 Tax=Dreissena polymorpha TaxID=45954 RepID=A0A9D4DMQ4_DREPO|nr:hypothetical protein DPMN_186724 [Dreissena polymorpha]
MFGGNRPTYRKVYGKRRSRRQYGPRNKIVRSFTARRTSRIANTITMHCLKSEPRCCCGPEGAILVWPDV